MRWLVDTNVLLRSAQTSHPVYDDVARSVSILATRRDELHVVAQNLIEFWAVATRPIVNNGLGLSVAQTEIEISRLKNLFALVPDTPDIFSEWEKIVRQYQVSGKQVHDARLVAAMLVHDLTHLLTFNDGDFKRFPQITTVNPQSII
ncbi:MAG TPA: PIN domain-containing protein [Pyrinomonadaceae bacterium]|nr:PIN domain-containing protein [Pyrinomonadaceae bacterium]